MCSTDETSSNAFRTCVLIKMGADEIAQRAIWSCSSSCEIASQLIPVLCTAITCQLNQRTPVQMQEVMCGRTCVG